MSSVFSSLAVVAEGVQNMSLTSKSERAPDYPLGQQLRHHAGSVWVVQAIGMPDDAFEGYYLIRCVGGTARRGYIGGEHVGALRRVHHDYLHGDGWRQHGAPD